MSLGDEHDGQTRTRLPEPGPGAGRPPARSSRSLIAVLGVVVLLVAAIALANRGDGTPDSPSSGANPDTPTRSTAPTAATGVRPVPGKNGLIPTGFARDEQGAQSAAANYAVALGSVDMFQRGPREGIVRAVHDPAVADGLVRSLDDSYSAGFLADVGLNPDGTAPAGLTFVSRTIPVGTKVKESTADTATVEVWCTGLVGLAGEGSTKPVTTTWFTITEKLRWVSDDWKVVSSAQAEGPTPVNGDNRASIADDIAKAVEGYGGFTYAR
ncbi:hypothetical protein ACIRTB_06470 [Streptomyces sp. NPDC101158]|uniref:hypothetical protein n=1 Tax=Streptomyces sp. NPDC101158 TaxID=3366117 RepID=UPI0038162914